MAMATSAMEVSEKRCVSCDKQQPRDGKLLHCLHVICRSCLSDSIRDPGCVCCALCGHTTTPPRHGADLSKQLIDCRFVLYGTSTDNGTSAKLTATETRASSPSPKCQSCLDIDISREAEYECPDCDNEPFCSQHAERHSSRRQFAGHRPRSLKLAERQQSSNGTDHAEHFCILHSKHAIIKFCQTCRHGVCQRCIYGGHGEHELLELGAAADAERTELKKALSATDVLSAETKSSQNSATSASASAATASGVATASTAANASAAADAEKKVSNKSVVQYVGAQAKDLSRRIDKVKEDTLEASAVINRKFEEIHKLVEARKDLLLADVEQRNWSLLEPLQLKAQQLRVWQETHATAKSLAAHLLSPDSNYVDVLHLSPIVVETLKRLTDDHEADAAGDDGLRIIAQGEETFAQLTECLKAAVTVSDALFDVSSATIRMSDRKRVGDVINISVQFFTGKRRQPVSVQVVSHHVTCVLRSPKEEKVFLPVTLPEAAESQDSGAVTVSFTPEHPGKYSLELRACGKGNKIDFEVDSPVRLSNVRAPDAIALSNGGRKAHMTKKGNYFALAEDGFTTGKHCWSIKVHTCLVDGDENKRYIGAGVAAMPTGSNFNSQFVTNASFYWRSSGYSVPGGCGSKPWANGDVLHFTLSCEDRTIEMVHERTGDHKVHRNIDVSKPLYPGVYLYLPGQEVEFL